MKAIRVLLACIRRADQRFDLFHHGDKIIIGLSGGKDSIALTYCLHLYRKFSHVDFEIQPVILDLGFPNFNPEKLSQFVESLGMKLIVSDNKDVFPVLKANQGNHSHLPCSICSRMKKAAINKVAKDLGYNKVAFAHHADDAIETLFMNEMYGGRIATFSPMMHLEKANIDFIRPFIYVREKDIQRFVKEENLPVFTSFCPADKFTTREDIKNTLNEIYHKYDNSYDGFLSMLENYEHLDIWDKQIYEQVSQDGLTLKPLIYKDDASYAHIIRNEVFIKEQGVSFEEEFVLKDEISTTPYLICLNKKPIGFIRYKETEDGIKIERFAILKEHRYKGYGLEVLNYLSEQLFKKFNPSPIYLNAQYHLVDFYKKAGYEPAGNIFIEGNIKHIKMILKKSF